MILLQFWVGELLVGGDIKGEGVVVLGAMADSWLAWLA